MKRIIILLLVVLFVLSSCGKSDDITNSVNFEINEKGWIKYSFDSVSFLRNDNTASDSWVTEETKITPGIYRVIDDRTDQILGEIEILKSGESVKLVVDYNTNSVRVER